MNSTLVPSPSRFAPADCDLRLADVQAARARLAHGLRRTPCAIAPAISQLAGMQVWLKRDDLQRTGSFKERGARHALLCLDDQQRARGVIAASAGNHALGLAYHGAQLGIPVTVVMPGTAPEVKVARCRSLGARVVLHGRSFDAAQVEAVRLAAASGATLVHPFDDPAVIAGQGTIALEIVEQAGEFDTVVLPVGGGGLLAGAAVALKALRPRVRIVAVEPENADAFRRSVSAGRPVACAVTPTLADGLAVARVCARTFALAVPRVDDVVTVSEAEIARAIAVLARRCGAVAEGAGATALAAVLAGRVRGGAIVVPVCGRNIDPKVHAGVLAQDAAAGSAGSTDAAMPMRNAA